jgi:hypothetical protein
MLKKNPTYKELLKESVGYADSFNRIPSHIMDQLVITLIKESDLAQECFSETIEDNFSDFVDILYSIAFERDKTDKKDKILELYNKFQLMAEDSFKRSLKNDFDAEVAYNSIAEPDDTASLDNISRHDDLRKDTHIVYFS